MTSLVKSLASFVVYDVEVAIHPDMVVGKWGNPEGMGFASAVAYSYKEDRYYFFLHKEGGDRFVDFLHGMTCVSFNGIHFDSRVIQGNGRLVNSAGSTKSIGPPFCLGKSPTVWKNYDILLEYIRSRFNYESVAVAESKLGDRSIHDGSFSLDGLARGTFGLGKTGEGAQAPLLYQDKKYEELLDYNLQDVRLTRKLFDFALQYGYVVDRSGRVVTMKVL